jgi:hypothetical protein
MSLADRHGWSTLTESQRDWLRVRDYLQRHRYKLGVAAANEYPDVLKVAETPLLTRREWLPNEPIPLDAIDLQFAPDSPFTGLASTDSVTASVRPVRPDGSSYTTYSAAMADLAAPTVFKNRSTYRLLNADLTGPRGRMVFSRGTYFDGIDVGEAAAHEYAASQLHGTDYSLRAAIGDPCEPARRPMNLAISTLTVRQDRATGEATFLLHWRDPTKVGHAGGLYMVVPVGIFQASDGNPASERNDFSLWRCMVREYAEELLGEPENHRGGQGLVNYDDWTFAARMTKALHSGLIRAHILGMGVDPLTFATDLLTVVVFDALLFDELFVGLVDANAEGRFVGMIGSYRSGFPFITDEVRRVVQHKPMQAAGVAALALADRNRILLHMSH